MTLPSTDPNRFAIHRRTRELVADTLETDVAREFASYEVLVRPVCERQHQQQQAAVYLEIHGGSRGVWSDVRDTLLASGFDMHVRHEEKTPYAPIPTTEQLLRLCVDHVMPLLVTEPESDLYEALVYVLREGTESRLAVGGILCGREYAQALCLQQLVHGLHDAYEHACVGSSYGSPNL